MRIPCALLALVSLAVAAPKAAAVKRGDLRVALERKGVFLPAGAAEIVLWPEAYRGEYLVLEVAPHGARVEEGAVVARLDDRAFAEQLRRAEFDLAQAEQRLRAQEEEARIQAQAAAATLERAERDAERAQKRLDGFVKIEQPQLRERERLDDLSWRDRIEDQQDELAELQKMYDADQLVDATEGIVLKRAQRGLARTQASYELRLKEREYQRNYDEAFRKEDLELDARHKADALDRQRRTNAIQEGRRDAELAKARLELELQREATARLARDRALFTLHAPRAGVVLHGSPKDAPWIPRLERGSRLTAYKCALSVADPAKLEVLADVPEADLAKVRDGAGASIRPAAFGETELAGAVRLAWLPTRTQDGANLYECAVALSGSDTRLRPGMRCAVRITVAEAVGALLVPLAAVGEEDGRKVVRCGPEPDGPFEPREVQLGIEDGKSVVVVSGVDEGEFVLLPEGK